jgi:CHASE3 domain sensor protein
MKGCGMRFSIEKIAIVSFCIGLLLIGIVGGFSYGSTNRLNQVIQDVKLTHQTVEKLNKLRVELKDVEMARQKYLNTNRFEYLNAYRIGISETRKDTEGLLMLLKGQPQPSSKVMMLESLIRSKSSEPITTNQFRQRNDITYQLNVIIGELLNDTQQQLQQKESEAVNDSRLVYYLSSAIGLLTIGIAILFLYALRHELAARNRLEAALRKSEVEIFQEKELAQVTLQSIGEGASHLCDEWSKGSKIDDS